MTTAANTTRTIMYLAYGDGIHQLGTTYSLLTAFRFIPPGTKGYRYVVYTDRPEAFERLGVEIRALSQEELAAWLDNSTYKHRRKTMSIIDALERFSGPVAFIDSDTYFKRSPALLFNRIGSGKTCFHTMEARLFEANETESQKLISGISAQEVRDGHGHVIPFSARDEMWNSGVLGVAPENISSLRAALPIMDQLWEISGSGPVEQFAVGYTLSGTRRMQSRDVVFHYWCNPVRQEFEQKLPDIISALDALAPEERPAAAWPHRPRWPIPAVIRSRIREATRWLGIPTTGFIKSV